MEKEVDMLSDTGTICNIVSIAETLPDNSQGKLDILAKKAIHLRFVLEKDFKACDIKWSMFVASAFSFRYESCVRPFPPAFLKNGVKDMDELLRAITDVPALDLVLQQLINLEDLSKVSDIIHLLFYILVRLKEPDLKTIPLESHDEVLELVQCPQSAAAPKPQYIFQVLSSAKSQAEQKWKDLAKSHHVFYAYHGTHLENFYSMLCFSVQQHLNKQSTVLGNGLYLTSDLSASLSHSRGGFGWGASCIGGHLSCVALCEVIDAPEGINYQRLNAKGYAGDNANGPTKQATRQGVTASHYIVTNSDLVRLRYIFVYAKQPAFMRFPATSAGNRNNGGLRQWLSRHKLFSILLGYGIMLATIGFANNQPLHSYYQILLNKLEIVYGGAKV